MGKCPGADQPPAGRASPGPLWEQTGAVSSLIAPLQPSGRAPHCYLGPSQLLRADSGEMQPEMLRGPQGCGVRPGEENPKYMCQKWRAGVPAGFLDVVS